MEKRIRDLLQRCNGDIKTMELVMNENIRILERTSKKTQYSQGIFRQEIEQIKGDLAAIQLGRQLFSKKSGLGDWYDESLKGE